ncbi:hypothetical protein [Veillonella ratti]|uniref:hypothetical protein n=1 Tax=Veillonella ratti TaxID=103892 RepID=UPI000F8DED46|nr:hypothetical protein [Veillonella ratti]
MRKYLQNILLFLAGLGVMATVGTDGPQSTIVDTLICASLTVNCVLGALLLRQPEKVDFDTSYDDLEEKKLQRSFNMPVNPFTRRINVNNPYGGQYEQKKA